MMMWQAGGSSSWQHAEQNNFYIHTKPVILYLMMFEIFRL